MDIQKSTQKNDSRSCMNECCSPRSRPDRHESPYTGLSLCSRETISSLLDGKVKVNQKRWPGGVIAIFINHKIINRDISVENTCLMQGFVSFDALLQGGKQSRMGT